MKYLILLLHCSTFLVSCNNENSKIQSINRSLIVKEFIIDIKDNKDDKYLHDKYFDKKNEQFRVFFTIRKSASNAIFQNIKEIIKTDTVTFIPYSEVDKKQEIVNCDYNESEVYVIKSERYNVIYYLKFNKNKIWSCSPIFKDSSIIGWDEW